MFQKKMKKRKNEGTHVWGAFAFLTILCKLYSEILDNKYLGGFIAESHYLRFFRNAGSQIYLCASCLKPSLLFQKSSCRLPSSSLSHFLICPVLQNLTINYRQTFTRFPGRYRPMLASFQFADCSLQAWLFQFLNMLVFFS